MKKYFGSDRFWILTSCVCFLGFLWSRGVCGILGWLAGKVVYRYASFTFLKNFLDFYLKPKSLTLKEKKKNLKPKMLLGSETEVFLTISTESATYPWGSFGDAEAQISGYKITVFFFPF